VQKFAYISGLTHFKCSFCNCNHLPESGLSESLARKAQKCKRRYVKDSQKRGVFIPDKDADWELDSSFDGHVREYDKCDIEDKDGNPACKNDRGPNFDQPEHKRNPHYIVLCSLCAAHGCHRSCRNIPAKDCENWVCDFCSDVLSKSKENRPKSPASSASRKLQNTNTPVASENPALKVTSDSRSFKKKEKIHGASRQRLNPMSRTSTDCPDRTLPVQQSPVTSIQKPAEKHLTSTDCLSRSLPSPIPQQSPVTSVHKPGEKRPAAFTTSTPKVAKKALIEEITLSDSD
jgi:hypothetical protein